MPQLKRPLAESLADKITDLLKGSSNSFAITERREIQHVAEAVGVGPCFTTVPRSARSATAICSSHDGASYFHSRPWAHELIAAPREFLGRVQSLRARGPAGVPSHTDGRTTTTLVLPFAALFARRTSQFLNLVGRRCMQEVLALQNLQVTRYI